MIESRISACPRQNSIVEGTLASVSRDQYSRHNFHIHIRTEPLTAVIYYFYESYYVIPCGSQILAFLEN